MKRVVLIAAAAAVALLFAGCAFEKSYFVTSGGSVVGICYQVNTSDRSVQNELMGGGWSEGTCAAQGFAGNHYCTYSEISGTESYEIVIYWGSSFDAATIESTCESSGWTFH